MYFFEAQCEKVVTLEENTICHAIAMETRSARQQGECVPFMPINDCSDRTQAVIVAVKRGIVSL